MHKYVHTYIHMYIHACIRTHTHTHIYTFHGSVSVSQRQQDAEEIINTQIHKFTM